MLSDTVISAVISAVRKGNRVAILAHQPGVVIRQLTERAPKITRVRRANGNEAIVFRNKAHIIVRRHPSLLRGYTADLLVVPIGLTHEQRDEVIPCAIPTGGDVIGYY